MAHPSSFIIQESHITGNSLPQLESHRIIESLLQLFRSSLTKITERPSFQCSDLANCKHGISTQYCGLKCCPCNHRRLPTLSSVAKWAQMHISGKLYTACLSPAADSYHIFFAGGTRLCFPLVSALDHVLGPYTSGEAPEQHGHTVSQRSGGSGGAHAHASGDAHGAGQEVGVVQPVAHAQSSWPPGAWLAAAPSLVPDACSGGANPDMVAPLRATLSACVDAAHTGD